MIDGLAMEVGDGRSTRFWEDTWLQARKLKDSFPRLYLISNNKGSVIGDCGFWDGIERVWNFQWRRELCQWETDSLNQPVLQVQSLTDDILSYKFTNGIRKGLVPPRIELFTWFVLVGRVNTKDRLSRLGIIERSNNVCVMCNKKIETVQHLFVTCCLVVLENSAKSTHVIDGYAGDDL
ncbi:uncharacterized protein [Arachis hypogaea]|uniref:uncharacterized protein n=1 Tax=Arachis hypogaea TaxID=3818 RepID=UPI003B226229